MTLVLALAAKTASRMRGVTEVNDMVDVGDFFSSQVLPELQAGDVNSVPVVKVRPPTRAHMHALHTHARTRAHVRRTP